MLNALSKALVPRTRFAAVPHSRMNVKSATMLDAEPLGEMFDAYVQGAGKPSNLGKATLYMGQRLFRKDSRIFMALKGSVPVGFMQLFQQFGATSMKPIWYIQDLFVKPEARRQGVASELLYAGKNLAAADKALLTLKTHLSNKNAQSLYQNTGFQETERSNKYVYYEYNATRPVLKVVH